MNRFFAALAAAASILALFAAAEANLIPRAGYRQRESSNVSSNLFQELEELARLVDISYCVGYSGVHQPFQCLSHCSEFEEFELVTTWNTGPLLSDSCGYIALSHSPSAERVIVAFRGTYSLTNTIVDLSAVPQAYVPYPADGGDDDDGSSLPSDGRGSKCYNCTVHAGFWTSWKSTRSIVLPSVTEAREKYPNYEVVLVGHSLGGAIAALAGLEMQLKGWNPRLTTFGEPRVGNRALAHYIDKVFNLVSDSGTKDDIAYRRVTHINDPIPLLPLEEWGYEMHAGEIYISKLDLPPSIFDLQICDGDDDFHCIAGDGRLKLLAFRGRKSSSSLRDPSPGKNMKRLELQEQQFEKMNAQWPLIPSRYRLWELFFAHRDYFWRIGLCVPGGDPGSWRE